MILGNDKQVLFSDDELRCKGTAKLRLDSRFEEALRSLRLLLDEPMKVNSCCRASSYNGQIGGHLKSLHICDDPQHPGQQGTMAIDIAVPSDIYRGKLARLALSTGWSVGVYQDFLHLDRRVALSLPPVLFYGK